jgi:hypothetical protein
VAGGDLGLRATGSVSILAGEDAHQALFAKRSSGFGLFGGNDGLDLYRSKRTSGTVTTVDNAASTVVAGRNASIVAGQDVNVVGSVIMAGHDLALTAGRDVNITPGAASRTVTTQNRRSGFGIQASLGNDSVSVGVGLRTSTDRTVRADNDNVPSVLAAGRDLHIVAGRDITLQAAQVSTERDLRLKAGRDINLLAAQDSSTTVSRHDRFFAGISATLSSPLIGAGQNLANAATGLGGRNGAESIAPTALAAYKTVQALGKGSTGSLTAGFEHESSRVIHSSSTPVVTSLRSGGSTTIVAEKGSITGVGFQIAAGVDAQGRPTGNPGAGTVRLQAGRDIFLESAQATIQTLFGSRSTQASIGVGPGGSVSAEGSYARDTGHSSEVHQVNSHVSGTGTVSLISGGDTSLRGAVVSGPQIVANVGGNLTIESRLDTARYRENTRQAHGSLGPSGASGGINSGRVRGDSTNVSEQSGLKAGDGGGVDLKGGMIISTADRSRNSLSADHLTYADVVNRSRASATSIGLSFNGSGLPSPEMSPPVRQGSSGVARATLSPGSLSLRNQQQDLGSLNTDPARADTQARPFDIERLKARQRNVAALSEIMNIGVGHLSKEFKLAEGSPEKVALHAAVGALTALASGGNVASGALAGGAQELVGAVIGRALADNPNLSQRERNALGQWAAVVVGAVTGGETGAATALDAERYNRQLHEAEKNRLKELAGGDAEKEARLNAAACALTHCADGVPPDDPQYATLKAMQDRGARDGEALDLLRRQTEDRTIHYCADTTCSDATIKSPLFSYTGVDQLGDYCSSGTTCTRAVGGGMLLLGGAGMAAAVSAGAATCVQSAGGGCAMAFIGGAIATDFAQSGGRQLITGSPVTPLGEQVLQSFGLSPIAAALIYASLGGAAQFGADAAALGRAGRTTSETRAVNRGTLYDDPSSAVKNRIDELTTQIPQNSQGRITMGVAVVEDSVGHRQVLISTSEANGYLRPGVRLNDGEMLVSGPRGSHAEADIIRYAQQNGLNVISIGATRPICSGCQAIIPGNTIIPTPKK